MNQTPLPLFALPVVIAHELCHYLAARVLGLPAQLHDRYTHVAVDAGDWRGIVAILAPGIAGLVFWLAVIWGALHEQDPTARIGLVILLVLCLICWQILCAIDYYDVWYYWRHGTYRAELRRPPSPDDSPLR